MLLYISLDQAGRLYLIAGDEKYAKVATVIEVIGVEVALTVMVSNKVGVTEESETAMEFVGQAYSWTGYFAVESRSKSRK